MAFSNSKRHDDSIFQMAILSEIMLLKLPHVSACTITWCELM